MSTGSIGVAVAGLGITFLAAAAATAAQAQVTVAPDQARAIAEKAYVFGFPMVDSYRIQYSYFADAGNPEFKAPWNHIRNTSRVFTAGDKDVRAPISDTQNSFAGLDLRAEPVVITVPPIEKQRYFSIQLVDAYTFNFAYIGSRTTGNGGGSFLIAGPGWKGTTPKGITAVMRSETKLAFALFRTQLFDPGDLENVKKVQSGYTVQPLSAFLGRPAPSVAPIDFVKPLTPEQEKTSAEFFNILNFTLRFCPTHPDEKELMTRFARISVGAGRAFDASKLSPELRKAIEDGIADAWLDYSLLKRRMDGGQPTLGDLFGTREYLQNNYLFRMGGAVLSMYGNSKEEVISPIYGADTYGHTIGGAKRYRVRFGPDQLPPVNAFWSLTMYEEPGVLLVANPINRYLLNSSMLPQFNRDADGGITFYVQTESPGANHEPNWLPAPKGAFAMALRLYWPKSEAIEGKWTRPQMVPVD
jgi:hypothetical protein